MLKIIIVISYTQTKFIRTHISYKPKFLNITRPDGRHWVQLCYVIPTYQLIETTTY